MTAWRRAALAIVRALRVHLRGRPFDDDEPAPFEIRDHDTGELLGFIRRMTDVEIREARAASMRPLSRGRRWLDHRRRENRPWLER